MARTQNLSEYLTDIATAIKEKKGDTTPINASKFDEEIANLPSGGGADEYFKTEVTTETNQQKLMIKLIKKVPVIDTSTAKDMYQMFYLFYALEEIEGIDTSSATNMYQMFGDCWVLKEIPQMNTSNVTNMSQTFAGCKLITTIPEIDTSNVLSASNMFAGCYKLITIPMLDFSKANLVSSMFNGCSKLENIGGFKNLGMGYDTTKSANYGNYTMIFTSCGALTHDSLMNVINNLYDLNLLYDVANGGTLKTQKLVLGSTLLAKLTAEEINIAVEKGWSVS